MGRKGYVFVMQLSVKIKIRLAVILSGSALLYGTIGWKIIKPPEPGGVLTILQGNAAVRTVPAIVVLAIVGTALAALIGGKFRQYLAAFSVPLGLSVWSLQMGGMERLLVDHVGLNERAGMYYRLAGDVIFWFGVVLLGVAAAGWMARWFKRQGKDGEENPPLPARKSFGRAAQQERKSPIFRGFDKELYQGIGAIVLSMVIAIVLLKFLLVAGRTWVGRTPQVYATRVPASGQIIFAVAAAFFLATMITYQIFTVKLWYFLPVPVLVALGAYIAGAQAGVLKPLVEASASFVASSVSFATVLPIQYVGIGTLALTAGYWYGIDLREYLMKRR